ncbi:MAG: glycosyltransferase family 39 protein, partial [Candidatus Mariimomonas ferrooxydans]
MVFRLGLILIDRNFGLLSGFIFSISPLLILRSSMIKSYSLVTFFGLLSIWLFLKAIRKDRRWMWITYTIASTLLIYTHYLPLCILLGQNIYIQVFRGKYKEVLKKWYLSQLCIFALHLHTTSTITH